MSSSVKFDVEKKFDHRTIFAGFLGGKIGNLGILMVKKCWQIPSLQENYSLPSPCLAMHHEFNFGERESGLSE